MNALERLSRAAAASFLVVVCVACGGSGDDEQGEEGVVAAPAEPAPAPTPEPAPVPEPVAEPAAPGPPPGWPAGVALPSGELRRSSGIMSSWRIEYPQTATALEAEVRAAVEAGGWAIWNERRQGLGQTIYICQGTEKRMFSFSSDGQGYGAPPGPGAQSILVVMEPAIRPPGACPASG